MKDHRVFGVNQRGDWRWVAWTCLSGDDGRVTPGTFRELSIHDTEQDAHDAANAARERHLNPERAARL
jgi:hypothetical protein